MCIFTHVFLYIYIMYIYIFVYKYIYIFQSQREAVPVLKKPRTFTFFPLSAVNMTEPSS